MKVAIRDDDTSYFTTPEALDRVYGDVWDRIPVCLAVVPFAIGYEQRGIPPEHWHSGESFALDRNPALVSFLRELIGSKRVTIALHGCTHQDYPNGYEFHAAPDLPDRVLRGGAVVPPGNATALANALERYLAQPDRARAAGTHNRLKASAEFSWRGSALQLLDVYRRVIDSRRGEQRASA